MQTHSYLTALLFATLALGTGCSRTPAPPVRPADALAQVGEEFITVAHFEAALARRRAAPGDEKARRAVLEELIRFRADLQEARRRGWERDPEIVAAFERALAGKVREEARQQQAAALEVSAAEIEAYYTAHQDKFRIPPRLRVAQLLVEAPSTFNAEKRAERRALLESARTRAASLAPAAGYGPIAAEVSFDQATKFRGGDVGYFTESTAPADWPAAATQAALALGLPGDQSEILETSRGFLLLRLTERSEGGFRPGPQVQAEIRAQLQREKQRAFEAAQAQAVLAEAKVQIDEERWKALPLPTSTAAAAPPVGSKPPAMPQ